MTEVRAQLGAGTVVDLQSRDFTWRADEPSSLGGDNAGPTPYELLLSGLASCIALTLRLYATKKRIPLDAVDVRMTFDRVHADDCDDCDARGDGLIEQVTTEVTCHGALDDEQQARLARVASRCPVHKTLDHGVTIDDHVRFVTPPK